jgi:hypothetical protein
LGVGVIVGFVAFGALSAVIGWHIGRRWSES